MAAEYLLRKLLLQKDKELSNKVEITSAGIVFKEISELVKQQEIPEPRFGRVPRQQVIDIASKHGVDVSHHRSKPFNKELAEWADLIIAMDGFQKKDVLAGYPQSNGRVFTFREFFEISGPTIIEDSFTLPKYNPDTGEYVFPYEYDEQTIDAIERCLSGGLKKILWRMI